MTYGVVEQHEIYLITVECRSRPTIGALNDKFLFSATTSSSPLQTSHILTWFRGPSLFWLQIIRGAGNIKRYWRKSPFKKYFIQMIWMFKAPSALPKFSIFLEINKTAIRWPCHKQPVWLENVKNQIINLSYYPPRQNARPQNLPGSH